VRRFSRVVLLAFSSVVLASTGVVAGATSAGAGVPVIVNSLTVLKTVTGEVPSGTTFTVSVYCNTSIIDDGGSGTDSATVEFDAAGQPTGPDTIDFLDTLGNCTVTETEDGGASSTTYACEGVATAAPVGSAVAPICPEAGPVSSPITVNKSYPGIDATVTVHNTFDPVPTTTTTAPPAPPAPAASPAIVARPTFTG
jgi:hypothetical protein